MMKGRMLLDREERKRMNQKQTMRKNQGHRQKMRTRTWMKNKKKRARKEQMERKQQRKMEQAMSQKKTMQRKPLSQKQQHWGEEDHLPCTRPESCQQEISKSPNKTTNEEAEKETMHAGTKIDLALGESRTARRHEICIIFISLVTFCFFSVIVTFIQVIFFLGTISGLFLLGICFFVSRRNG